MNKFPGGEINANINTNDDDRVRISFVPQPEIFARITNSDDLMLVLLYADALKRDGYSNINLVMYYVPYSRQDRVCNPGEAFSLKVFCDIINSVGFKQVTIFDPHSDVTPALLHNVDVMSRFEYMKYRIMGINFPEYDYIVCPDGGARKKVMEDVKYVKFKNEPRIVFCDKVRDLQTGKLSGFEVYADDCSGDCLIIDDICDGGGTFIGLANVLKSRGATNIDLFVSHGIFSQGLDKFEGLFRRVYTTSSYPPVYVQEHPMLVRM